MMIANGVCEKCGAKIVDDTTQEVCPACLLETGLRMLEHQAVVGVANPPARSVKRLPNFLLAI
jgi:NMD protein affecting ribosome stability and mRNA decay